MFSAPQQRRTAFTAAYEMVAVTYHATVRAARGKGENALFGLLSSAFQTVFMVGAIYFSMYILGWRAHQFRGDYILFLMVGVMSYGTYNRAMRGVYSADGPTSPMLQHAPLNTIVSISSAALAGLYIQLLSTFLVLTGYHLLVSRIEIQNPVFAVMLLLAAWVFGIATGLLLMAVRPWWPRGAPLLMMVVSRANVFFSGKMMVANAMSYTTLKCFDWNPLFHVVDQMRGAVFLNYVPRNSEVPYIFEISAALIAVGMMGEFIGRKRARMAW